MVIFQWNENYGMYICPPEELSVQTFHPWKNFHFVKVVDSRQGPKNEEFKIRSRKKPTCIDVNPTKARFFVTLIFEDCISFWHDFFFQLDQPVSQSDVQKLKTNREQSLKQIILRYWLCEMSFFCLSD